MAAAAGDDGLTVFEGEQDGASTIAETTLPHGETAVTVVADDEVKSESGDTAAPTILPADPADPVRTAIPGPEPFNIPMAPASDDTVAPSVRVEPAPAALPTVGVIERLGHTIQGLQSQNEVLRSTVEALASSVATMAAAAAAATAADSDTGPGAAATPSSSADPMVAKGGKLIPTNPWEQEERWRRDARNAANTARKARKTLAEAKSKSAAARRPPGPGPTL